MDQFGQNAVDPQQMILNFDASRHPDVSAGARTADDVMREFMETFDVGGVKPGKITRDEFVNYFHNISATTNEDDYMELIIRRTWRLGEDPVVVKQQQQVLLQEFQDQQRQLAATTRPSSRNGLGDNNVSSRIRNAQTFGQEHWNGNNNGAMAAPRPSTAGGKLLKYYTLIYQILIFIFFSFSYQKSLEFQCWHVQSNPRKSILASYTNPSYTTTTTECSRFRNPSKL